MNDEVSALGDSDEVLLLGELVSKGLRAVVAGDYRRAAMVLEQARAIDPGNARVLHQLKRLEALGYGSGTTALAALPVHSLRCAPIIDVGDSWADDEDVHTGTGCSP